MVQRKGAYAPEFRQQIVKLVGKEFVAMQDPNDPGVMVLSRFAGFR
jgi:trehalose-6-phosphate synthase